LILRKIIKIVATRSHILRLSCTKFDFGWGSAQLTALPRPPSWILGVLVLRGERGGKGKGGKGEGREREKGREGGEERARERKGQGGGKGRGTP